MLQHTLWHVIGMNTADAMVPMVEMNLETVGTPQIYPWKDVRVRQERLNYHGFTAALEKAAPVQPQAGIY